MAISKQSYNELKEYWDYQRKVEYNKEMVYFMAEKFKGRVYNDFGMVHIDEMKNLLWLRVDPKDYEDPKDKIKKNKQNVIIRNFKKLFK